MAGNSHSLKTGIIYIGLGGVVLFLAVFLGIQAGFALRSDGTGELTPDNLPNRSLLKKGDAVPSLPVYTIEGEQMSLEDVTGGRKTLIGVVMPGCDPCKILLTGWGEKGIINGQNDFQVILVASTPEDDFELGPLADFADNYTVYFCDHTALKEYCGISTFPSIMGLKNDNTVGFVANGYVHKLDEEFFNEYL